MKLPQATCSLSCCPTPMADFPTVIAALQYVVDSLIPMRHRFIVEMRGPDGFSAGQFVDEKCAWGSPGYGLTLYLAFDPSAGREREERFLACRASGLFQLVPWDGIPCYAARFGVGVSNAARVHWVVATTIYYNADSMDLRCCVHDGGGRSLR